MEQRINETKILNGFFNGAKNVIDKREELNQINVFPVADGDTGTNLASLMTAILGVKIEPGYNLATVLNATAEAALTGARGNSGIIFAQFFSSMAKNTSFENVISNFIEGVNCATRDAYQAVVKPEEGTILTVMRKWALALDGYYQRFDSFEQALTKSQEEAYHALVETTEQLAVLKRNQVVDSGAKGFYLFIEGFTQGYLSTEGFVYQPENQLEVSNHQRRNETNTKPTYRYCTEVLVGNVTQNLRELRSELQHFGDSLVVAGDQHLMKVHLHTNEPAEVVLALQGSGVIKEQKVDDMLLQFELNQTQKFPYAVITDSIADLPQEFLLENQVHVLPMTVQIDQASFLDKQTITNQTIEQYLKHAEKLTTAQPSIKSIDNLLSFLQGKYQRLIFITVSSELSGTYQLIKQRVSQSNFAAEDVIIIDSKLNSAGQGILVLETIKMLKEKSAWAGIEHQLNQLKQQIQIFVAVSDLTPMINSGRIPRKIGVVAQKLGLYPIVSLSETGQGKLVGATFSRKASERKIIKMVQKIQRQQALEYTAIVYTGNQLQGQELNEALVKGGLSPAKYMTESSVAVTISAGINSVAIALLRKGGN